MKNKIVAAGAIAAALPFAAPAAEAPNQPVRIAKWRGDAKGAVSLYYDDGTESAFRNVVPELARRGLPGTFYICCGWFKGRDDPKLVRWGTAAKEHPQAIFLGDHTWAHGGVTNAAQFADEIERNGALLRELAGLQPDDPLSFALPGAVRWDVKPAEQAEVLARHHEVLRHRFEPNVAGPKDGKNPNFTMRTAADAAKAFDRAEAEGKWEALIFHGVGGDWIAFDLEEHGRMLDDLEARAREGRIWVGSAIDVHLYEEARDAARVEDVRVSEEGLDFKVTASSPSRGGSRWCAPLAPQQTLVCTVPADWKRARILSTSHTFGAAELAKRAREGFEAPVSDGKVVFDLPNGWVGVSVRKAE